MKDTIKSKDEISWLFSHGGKFVGAGFMALYSATGTKTKGAGATGRVAFIAGKKLGSAPLRSRAKRRLREAARAAGAPWRGYDVVLVARQKAVEVEYRDLTSSFSSFSQKLLGNKQPEQQPNQTAKPDESSSQSQTRFDSKGSSARSFVVGIPRSIALLCIYVYRHAISPLFPPSCGYVPTCSEYAMIAFERFGFWRGFWLSAKRIGRCHPFAKGGYDPVPDVFEKS